MEWPFGFADLKSDTRMRAWDIIKAAGGSVMSYGGGSVYVALPRDYDAQASLRAGLLDMGIEAADEPVLFPLCSDKPRAELRHNGPYNWTGEPGYWMFQNFRPTAELKAREVQA